MTLHFDMRPRNGIALPLSALRGQKSTGIGEFLDLLPLLDWCQEVGMEVLQLLPLNDSGNDPSPYYTLSSCALNPIYLSLHALPGVSSLPDNSKLNSLPRTSYHEVQSLKLNFLRTYYEAQGATLREEPAFQTFIQNNPWVVPYALFKVLKEQLENNPWTTWPEELKKPDYSSLCEKHHEKMLFHITVQYLCFLQLTQVKTHAHQKGVLLKGDIPILISPDSVDVWLQPELFDLTLSAGAPPDMYNREGQYWGLPLFNWEAIKKENYNWWSLRLKTAAQYFDLYRIDHIVGFFRIWGIPLDRTATEGKFYPENPALWIPQGKEILLKMLEATSMLPIGEDLGTIPPSVRACLQELGICGMKVIRWERHYDTDGSFIPFSEYPKLSLTTISTADSPTLQEWWQESPEEAKAFAAFKGWTYSPDLSYAQRFEILRDSHMTPSLFHINLFQEYLALFSHLVWPNPKEERINIPGKILPINWIYRFRPTLEEICSSQELKSALKSLNLRNYPKPSDLR